MLLIPAETTQDSVESMPVCKVTCFTRCKVTWQRWNLLCRDRFCASLICTCLCLGPGCPSGTSLCVCRFCISLYVCRGNFASRGAAPLTGCGIWALRRSSNDLQLSSRCCAVGPSLRHALQVLTEAGCSSSSSEPPLHAMFERSGHAFGY